MFSANASSNSLSCSVEKEVRLRLDSASDSWLGLLLGGGSPHEPLFSSSEHEEADEEELGMASRLLSSPNWVEGRFPKISV